MYAARCPPPLMDPRGRSVTKNAYFSLLIHIKQILFVAFYDTTTEIGSVRGKTEHGYI